MWKRLISLLLLLLSSAVVQADGCRYGEGKAGKQRADEAHDHEHEHHMHGKCGGMRRGGGERRYENKEQGRRCLDHDEWDIPETDARQLNPVAVSPESLARGESVYRNNCKRCHGDHGMGDGPDAAELDVQPVNLRHATRHHSDGELSYMIRTGRGPMPSWQDKLSQDELWDLINYVRFEIGGRRWRR